MTVLNLTEEMRQALATRPTGPLPVEDDQTKSQYVLVSKEEYFRLHEEYIRRELQVAFDEVDRGQIDDLDMSAVLVEAHRRHAARE